MLDEAKFGNHSHPEAERNQACNGARAVAARSPGVANDPPGAAVKGTPKCRLRWAT
jgi:hypothetical protein